MVRYEYKVFEVEMSWSGQSSTVPEDELNELGAEGWDIVAPITERSGKTTGQQSGKTTGLVMQRER